MPNLLLSNIMAFLLLTYLGNNLLDIREINKYKHILIYCFIVISLTILNGKSVSLSNTLNITIGYLVYLFCIYKFNLLKQIVVLLSFILFNALGEVLAANLSNMFFGLNSKSDIASFQYTIAILFSETITYLFLLLYVKIIKFSYWGELPKYTYLITILPITTMFFLINIQDYFYLLRKHVMLVITLIGLLISNFIVVFIFLKVVSALKLKNELDITKAEKKNLDFKYELLNTQYKATYTFMHDSMRAIMKIQSFLDKGDKEQFKNALLSLNNSMLKGLNIVNSNSSVVSPIINFRLKEMLKNNVDFKSVLEYTDFTFLNLDEQRSIFDTLLEIGMLQCSNTKTKTIILKTKKIYKQIIIQLISTHGNIKNNSNFILLYNNLFEIVEKHNGKISFENLNEKFDSLIMVFYV